MMKITIQPLREEALRAGYAALLERLPHGHSYEWFCGSLADWDVRAFHDGRRTVGMLMTRGAELHVAVLPEVRGRWLSRRLIREVFGPILKAHGHAETMVETDNRIGMDFVRRIRDGFADLRFDPVSAIGAGASIVGGAIQGSSAKKAAKTAANAQMYSADVQKQMFDTVNAQTAPWRQSGEYALRAINQGFGFGGAGGMVNGPQMGEAAPTREQFMLGGPGNALTANEIAAFNNAQAINPSGISLDQYAASIGKGGSGGFDTAGYEAALKAYNARRSAFDAQQGADGAQSGMIPTGYFAHQFGAGDLNANMAPNWAFSLAQGQGAARNAGNLQTGLVSGNTMKGLADYTLAKSGDLYQQAYNNYTANQSNIFNRLSNLAGLGSGANQIGGSLAGSIGPSIGNAYAGAGAAQAAGTVGMANAISGGLNNAAGWYALSNMNAPAAGAGNYNAAGTFQPYYSGVGAAGDYQYG